MKALRIPRAGTVDWWTDGRGDWFLTWETGRDEDGDGGGGRGRRALPQADEGERRDGGQRRRAAGTAILAARAAGGSLRRGGDGAERRDGLDGGGGAGGGRDQGAVCARDDAPARLGSGPHRPA